MNIVPQSPTPASAGVMGEIQSEVAVEAAPLLQFIVRHMILVVGGVLLLIAAIVATGAYQWYQQSAREKAEMALGRVLSGSLLGGERVAALEKLLADTPQSLQQGLRLEIALAAVAAEQFSKAAEQFALVAAADSGPLGLNAMLNQANVLLRAGEAAKAVSVLEKLESTAPESMRALVRETLAGAAEAAGNTARAIAAYQALLSGGTQQDGAYYKARIAALQAAPAATAPAALGTPAPALTPAAAATATPAAPATAAPAGDKAK